MNISSLEYFLLLISSYALVGILTPLMRRIAISKDILDRPDSTHKSHTSPTPYLGGVAIIIGVLIVTYGALIMSGAGANNFWLATSLLGPAVAIGVIGLWDDIKNLHPLPRFIGQSIAGLIVAILLVFTNNLGNPTGSTLLDILITVLWIVGICNSINFFDNLDGGAAGTTAISAIALSILTLSNGQTFLAALSLVITGATLGFLIWNKSPARIYMGDAGALFLGVLIAILTVRLNPETDSRFTSFVIPILLLAIPILDTIVAVISRLRRGVSPFQGGKDHLSHRLIRLGLSRKVTAILLWFLSAIFATIAIVISFDLFSNEFVGLSFGIVFWIFLLGAFLSRKDI
ncbi:MAG: MraY family glycosyltransferase [Actinomycetota bacterium]|nr:MraY family glycosyltransferase [Actinomycetota bacterium]